MKRIFLLLLSASVIVSCSRGGRSSAGKPGTKGELIPGKASKFVSERPYGMVSIPSGSYIMGLADQDMTNMPEKAGLKTVTVSSFFIDEAETTNNEYRVFINYVRDSIARTLLAEAAGEGGDGNGGGRSIGDYSYLTKDEQNLTPFQEYKESQGANQGFDEPKKLNWRLPLHWRTSDYPDVEYAEVVESLYLPAAESAGGRRSIDSRKLKYAFEKKSLAIYPDTTVWIRDFSYSYNEPMFEQYFWHKAYGEYPIIGVTWDQARAYCDFRTKLKSDYNESLKRKKQRPMKFRLPTEAEWEYAARGGLTNATYPWGGPYLADDRNCFLANFKPKRGNYLEDEKKGTYTYTAPVKKFSKNGFGLYDMAGNVAEWTISPYSNSSYEFSSTLNPTTNDKETRRAVRGGSWKDIGYMLMVGNRDWERKDSARSYIGFRTVQDIPEAAIKKARKVTK